MRVVFCDNVLIDQAHPNEPFDVQPHLGLLSLLSVALEHGHEGDIFDPSLALERGDLALDGSLYESLARALLEREPDVLGFTALGCNLICVVKTAAHVKRLRPGLPVVLGGPHGTILHREIAREMAVFDVVVRHEAETSLPALMAAFDCGPDWRDAMTEVAGVTFRRGGDIVATAPAPIIEDLDGLPWPAYAHYPIETLGLTSLRVEAGRGCPFSCTFCSTASFFGRRYRLKSPARLVGELDYLHREYGIADFALTHDMFTANRNKVLQFCAAVADRGYTWTCSARMDCVDPELLAAMREAGCRSIYYGVETGSPRMQKITDKHLDIELVEPVLDLTVGMGMAAVVSMITGFPQETDEDQDATLDMLGACTKQPQELVSLQLHLLTPEPGTALFHERGDTLAYDGHVSDFNFPTLEADDAEVMSRHPELFMTHHYYPSVLPRELHVFAEQWLPVLVMLGHPLLSRMLRDFDGRLSQLMRALRRFLPAAGDADGRSLEDFAAHTWGSQHPLASAVRFVMAGIRLRHQALTSLRSADAGAGSPARGRAPALVRSSQTELLNRIHDVPRLLEALQRDPEAGDRALGEPDRNLLLLVSGEQPRTVRSFEVDGVALTMLELLEEPLPAEDLEGWMRAFGSDAAALQDLLQELCELTVVVPTEAVAAAAMS